MASEEIARTRPTLLHIPSGAESLTPPTSSTASTISTAPTSPLCSDNSSLITTNKQEKIKDGQGRDHTELWYVPNLTLVAPGLYLGNVGSSWDVPTLRRHGISSLLTMLNNPEPDLWCRWDHLHNRKVVPRGRHMFVYTCDEPDFDNLGDMKGMLDWIDGQLVVMGHSASELSGDVVKIAVKIAAEQSMSLPAHTQVFLDALATSYSCPAPQSSVLESDNPLNSPDGCKKDLWGTWAGFVAPEGYETQHFKAAHVLAEASLALEEVSENRADTSAIATATATATAKKTEQGEIVEMLTDLSISNSENKAHVLVHCKAGMSRSASVVACWLMRRDGFHRSVDDILQDLSALRGKVNLNPSFRVALNVWHACRGQLFTEEKKPVDVYAEHLVYIATPECKDAYYDWRTAWSGEPFPAGYPFSKN